MLALTLPMLFGFESPRPSLLVAGITSGPTAVPSAPDVGTSVTFSVSATGGPPLTYAWDFGDGTTTAPTVGDSSHAHTYTAPKHYLVRVSVDEVPSSGAVIGTLHLTVTNPKTATSSRNSSTILLDAANSNVWCVNADQDTVTCMSTAGVVQFEKQVGKAPRTLAQAADHTIWVVSQQNPSIAVLDPTTGTLLHVIPLPHGSLPYGICMNPDASVAYVSFQGTGGVQSISTSSRSTLASSAIPPAARGISVTGDGRVFVTRFISPQSDSLAPYQSAQFIAQNHGEVVELTSGLGVVRTINLQFDPGVSGPDPDLGSNVAPTAFGSRGVPNYLTSMFITPDGKRAWVPSKKDNISRGTSGIAVPGIRDGQTPGPEITYRAIVSSIDLTSSSKTTDELTERFDIKDSEMPQSACTSPRGDLIFIALQGNNRVQVRDLYLGGLVNGLGDSTGAAPGGLAPQGLVLDPQSKKLFVHNYMGRSIAIFDATAVLNWDGVAGSATLGAPTLVGTIAGPDALAPNPLLVVTPLLGKQVFYNAGNPQMSFLGYISCAGCHLDGGSDMRVWDFTDRGEGFRNTIMLQGRGDGAGGMKHGNVHWSANFNEIQDFDNDIFNHFGGTGFPSGTTPNAPMGAPNATLGGGSGDNNLNGLAAYVTSLAKVSRSPFRNADGSLTASGARGEQVFVAQNCATCHKGREFTDSTIFTLTPPAVGPGVHDVGTKKTTSGQRLGTTLPGIDTPTLKGIWQTAPYFHDGSAASLSDVIAASGAQHGSMSTLTAQQKSDLVEYLLELDEIDPGDRLSTDPPVTVSIASVATGRPYSLATAANGSFPFVDRSYTFTSALTAAVSGKILLRTAADDTAATTASLITVTLTNTADVYVFYDSRAGATLPTWLQTGWTRSAPDDITISPGLLMNAYKQSFPAGSVVLGGNQQSTTPALRNYFVIVNQTAGGVVFEEGPISQTEWVHDRDADGDGLHDDFEAVNSMNPWKVNGQAVGAADEDFVIGSTTAFQTQAAAEAVPASGGGGGGGGCGLGGLEFLLPMVAMRLWRRRRA
jgi:mono/diheme cytochrome c family protein